MTPARPRLLVERDPQLARLGEAIGQVANGHGGCLCLVGEAGSGKTRLLLEAREMARRQGLTVLAASPPAVTTPPAFGLIAQALRSWTRVHPEPHQDLSRFALGIHQVLPEWELPSGAAALAPHQMRLLVLEGALQLLLKASAPMGGLLVLDDLHGSDPESIEFLHYAAAAVPDEQLLLLA